MTSEDCAVLLRAASVLVCVMMATVHVSSFDPVSSENNSTSGVNENGSRNAVVMNLAVILPFSGDYAWSLPQIKPAVTLAVDDVASTSNSTSGSSVDFRINYGDSECSETMGPLAAIDMYLQRRADVFIGPACDYSVSPVARFSPHWNIPVVTAGALVSAFRLKFVYRLLTRMTSPYSQLGAFIVDQLMVKFNWTTAGIVYQNNLGVRAMKRGKSRCYFTVEGVYTAMQRRQAADISTSSKVYIWRKVFDPEGSAGLDADALLRELQLKARSTSPSDVIASHLTSFFSVSVIAQNDVFRYDIRLPYWI